MKHFWTIVLIVGLAGLLVGGLLGLGYANRSQIVQTPMPTATSSLGPCEGFPFPVECPEGWEK